MYVPMSTVAYIAQNAGKWAEALADAESRYAQADKKEKCRWQGVIGIIQDIIERKEPWPV